MQGKVRLPCLALCCTHYGALTCPAPALCFHAFTGTAVYCVICAGSAIPALVARSANPATTAEIAEPAQITW